MASRSVTLCGLLIGLFAFSAAGCQANVSTAIAPLVQSSAAPLAPLPAGAKGWELYAWQENGQWLYSLLMGTNRLKSWAEVTEPSAPSDFSMVRMAGTEALKAQLARLQKGEIVMWQGANSVTDPTGARSIALPPAEVQAQVKIWAAQGGWTVQP